MRILISGGTGFIGRAVCEQLRPGGHRVTVWSRDPRHAAGMPKGVHLIQDLAEANDIDAVINLAGQPLVGQRWTARRKQAIRQSRIGTTEKLMRWIATQVNRPHVLVSGSAIGYYGSRGDVPLDESAAPGDDFAARLCRDWEHAAMEAESLGLRVCRLRTGIVLGPQGGALKQMLPPFRLGLGGPIGRGDAWFSWIHREDIARFIVWLIENDDAGGAYNATSPHPLPQREFAATLGRVLHRPAFLPTPRFALKLLFGEGAELLLASQRVLPVHAIADGFTFRHPRLQPALEHLLCR